jgi:uncharacterized protein
MNKEELIKRIEDFVRDNITSHDAGHDWWHINRVRNLSLYICSNECNGDMLTVEISALMHDVGDKKFRKDDDENHLKNIYQLLEGLHFGKRLIDEVIIINSNISFSKGSRPLVVSPEFMAVQDADRIDAIGAIGIARAFNYGGYINNSIWDPKGLQASTVGHFYDKLLNLKDLMNTETGRKIADERHKYLESFLVQFYNEWKFGDKGGI